jgi:hypothetical protein
MNLELKYEILRQLIDEPVDECNVYSMCAAIGADHTRTLQAIAELVRDGFIEAETVGTGGFTLRIRQQQVGFAAVKTQWLQRRSGA